MERFGWTQAELDEQDVSRLMPGLHANGYMESLHRTMQFVSSQGHYKPSPRDWEIWAEAQAIYEEERGSL